MSGVDITIVNQLLVLNISGDISPITVVIPNASLGVTVSNSGTQGIQGDRGPSGIEEATSDEEEEAAFLAGAKIVVRVDLI